MDDTDGDGDDYTPRRSGLGFFPAAVVIRDHAPPSRIQPAPYDISNNNDGNYPGDDYHTPYPVAGPSGAARQLQLQPPTPLAAQQGRDSWSLWKDWNTNPSGHGGRRRGPPAFVPAQNEYDDMGHQLGVDVVVDLGGEGRGGHESDNGEAKMSGSGVADWYSSLLAGSANGKAKAKEEGGSGDGDSKFKVATNTRPTPPTQPPLRTTTVNTTPAQPKPVRVAPSEWFIRRALASSSLSTPGSTSSSRTPTPSRIGAMLNLDPARAGLPAPEQRVRYALGPDNAGYARLAALGWRGGGLGRPDGWQPGDDVRGSGSGSASPAALAPTCTETSSPSGSVDTPVDLTGDSEDEAGASATDDTQPPPVLRGPGRTAPIATALKLDRAGLGRAGGADKKVTHTAAEIARAQRRARGVKVDGKDGGGTPPGKKTKVKWAERERQERDERRRLAAVLNG